MAKQPQTYQPNKTATTTTTTDSKEPAVVDAGTTDAVTTTEPTVEPTAPVVEQLNQTTVVETQQDQVSDFDAAVLQIKETGTILQKGLIAALEAYIEPMRPGVPVGDSKGAQLQYALWQTISSVMEDSGEEFTKLWMLLLAYFNQYKDGVFADRYVYRFSEFWLLGSHSPALDAFQRILNLIKLTADPVVRADNLKHVDLGRTLELVFSEAARQRVIGFYSK